MTRVEAATLSGGVAGPSRQVELSGVRFDDIGFDATVDLIVRWAEDGSGGYVCTPNVDHLVRARRHPAFRAAIDRARLRVPDGMGVVYGAMVAGRRLRRSVTGRLLPVAIARRARGSGLRLAIFGGAPGVAERAAVRLRTEGADVAAAFGPGMDFRIDSDEDAAAVARLREAAPHVLFVCLGSPKQELWMARHAMDLATTVLVGVGAAVDVLGGQVREAPAWMTRVGLEWAFRLAQEPRRLARRYLWDDPRFFWWMAAERLTRR